MSDNSLVLYGLLLITGLIHIFVGLSNTLLLLNGIGFIVLIFFDFLAEYRGYGGGYQHWIILIYTAITFFGYFIIYLPQGIEATLRPAGIISKLDELAIMIFKIYKIRQ